MIERIAKSLARVFFTKAPDLHNSSGKSEPVDTAMWYPMSRKRSVTSLAASPGEREPYLRTPSKSNIITGGAHAPQGPPLPPPLPSARDSSSREPDDPLVSPSGTPRRLRSVSSPAASFSPALSSRDPTVGGSQKPQVRAQSMLARGAIWHPPSRAHSAQPPC